MTKRRPPHPVVGQPEHRPEGDGPDCARCGQAASRHRTRRRPGRKGGPHKNRRGCPSYKDRRRRQALERAAAKRRRDEAPIVAIDGEGRDDPCAACGHDKDICPALGYAERCSYPEEGERRCYHCGRVSGRGRVCREGRGGEVCLFPHVYTYLAAVDELGDLRGEVYRPDGLSSLEVLEWLLSLGAARVFGFSLGYDLCMMLRDLPDAVLYRLVRPELRAFELPSGQVGHRPEHWRGFRLNYMRRRFTAQREEFDPDKGPRGRYVGVGAVVVAWDVFGFYQSKFTKALADWNTAGRLTEQAVIDEVGRMKDARSSFDRMTPAEIQAYCRTECHLLAKLVRRLIESCDEADLPLAQFYGAGSIASALLSKIGVSDYRAELPGEMALGVASAFFGGRFELSRLGPVEQEVYNHDISSAYPYELARLPCLTHGRWRRHVGAREVDAAVRDGAALALVHCEVRRSGPREWGPLPWRAPDGTITWPLRTDGTWCWGAEYLAAKDTLWTGVVGREAWVYRTRCRCRPFAELGAVYRERCRIGKDGAGIILKLGPNSVYGKLAQSVGAAPFQSWCWAGAVTSGTRAQLLRAIAAAKDPASVLMTATDGILSLERLALGAPEDTGTYDVEVVEDGLAVKKPLGGWELKTAKRGVFLARPGIYWPMGATDKEVKEVRARGLARAVVLEHAERIARHFKTRGWQVPYRVDGCVRFVGMKQGVGLGEGSAARMAENGNRIEDWMPVRRAEHGCWIDYPVEVDFKPAPKRAAVLRDLRLQAWARMPGESRPYSKATSQSPEALALRELEEVLEDSADGDLCRA